MPNPPGYPQYYPSGPYDIPGPVTSSAVPQQSIVPRSLIPGQPLSVYQAAENPVTNIMATVNAIMTAVYDGMASDPLIGGIVSSLPAPPKIGQFGGNPTRYPTAGEYNPFA